MDITQTLAASYALLEQYGLVEWTVKLGRGKNRLGLCDYNNKAITISKNHILHGEDHEVIDVIKHEIAHALAGPGTHHGPEWRAWAKALGAKTDRLIKVSYTTTHQYELTCPSCPMCQHRQNRISQKRLKNLMCKRCGIKTLGKLMLRAV